MSATGESAAPERFAGARPLAPRTAPAAQTLRRGTIRPVCTPAAAAPAHHPTPRFARRGLQNCSAVAAAVWP